jgi:hypothetical protein
MKYKICTVFLLLLFCCITSIKVHAQNFTGTWEGVTDDGEFIQINVVQVGATICGYSYDYEVRNKKSYCKANFTGYFNKTRNMCYVEGTSFVENSGTHVLMNLKFSLVYNDGVQMLEGALQTKSSRYSDAGAPSYFLIRKISKKPTTVTSGMQACLPPVIEPTVKSKPLTAATPKKQNGSVSKPIVKTKPATKPSASVVKKPVPKLSTSVITKPTVTKPKVTVPIVKKPAAQTPPVVKKIEPVKTITAPITTPSKPPTQLVKVPEVTNGRKNSEQSRIILSEKKINISIYDNGTVDGDTVSIFFDGKMVVSKKRLTTTPISVDLELDESINLHTLILFADNLGSIPPNTALVVVTTASGKRYELYSSATFEKNAALIFEYKPK